MELLFWISAALIAYPYVGYPLALRLLIPLIGRSVPKNALEPTVTLVISAYNEAANMRRKLDNTLQIDYPREKLQILAASDASTDSTDAIISEYAPHGIELIRLPERGGKVACQNAAIARATGEILVFSDARIMISADSLRAMMENFADSTVGCVSSQDQIVAADGSPDAEAGEGFYVRYEMALRRLEARLGSLVGASGSFYAVRRHLADVWEAGFERDFLTPLKVAAAGLRTVHEPRAIGAYRALAEPEAEFRRKVRTVMRGMAVLFHMRSLLNPLAHPLVAWQLWSHKILRWTVPFFLLSLLVSSAALAGRHPVFALALAAQVALYALALAAFIDRRLEARLLFRVPLFFTNANLVDPGGLDPLSVRNPSGDMGALAALARREREPTDMCGITGIWNLEAGQPIDRATLEEMNRVITHRGPDEDGFHVDPGRVGLAMRRLKIIDLETGSQPIANEDGSAWVTFNGEIYNFRELRAELEAHGHRFRTRSDTEVIIHAYEEYGPRCVEKLRGMFTIAIWDARRERLVLARDRVGIKQLFYTVAGGQLLWGSELKCLLRTRRSSAG